MVSLSLCVTWWSGEYEKAVAEAQKANEQAYQQAMERSVPPAKKKSSWACCEKAPSGQAEMEKQQKEYEKWAEEQATVQAEIQEQQRIQYEQQMQEMQERQAEMVKEQQKMAAAQVRAMYPGLFKKKKKQSKKHRRRCPCC